MEGADDAAIRLSVNTTSILTTKVIIAVCVVAIKKIATGIDSSLNHGHIDLKKLTQQGKALEIKESMQIADISKFKRTFKRHGVDFTLVKKSNNTYDFFFKANDHKTIDHALHKVVESELKKARKQTKMPENKMTKYSVKTKSKEPMPKKPKLKVKR